MKVKIDKEKCTGCGICVDTCPDVFYIGGDELAEVKNPLPQNKDCIKEAADSCPNEAIIIED